MEDIVEVSEGTKFQDVTFTDKIRVFSGDNPARQFEAGQQRGGAYSCLCGIPSKAHINLESCYKQKPQDLEDRRKLVTEGYLWKKIEGGNFNPFKNLKKEEIINELDYRKIEIIKEDKPSLQQELTELLHGICRPPALMLNNPSTSASEHHIAHYEIMQCEPLHDITNVVQNVLTELPHHVEDPETKLALEKFTTKAIGDKNQLKGSDARCIAIKLEKLVHSLFLDDKISNDIVKMVSSMVEIIHIAYSPEEKRSPRQVLRLFNITFLFGVLAKSVIANPVKMTQRKFYGNHFHSIVTHLAETYRIMNTKSVLTEDEERSFGLLRRISETTSNRKPGDVIDNAIIRYNCQSQADDRLDSLKKQECEISRLAKLLPERTSSVFNKDILMNKSSLYQTHLSRIAEFVKPGENIWWHFNGDSVVFHDSQQEPSFRDDGPLLLHFRSSSLKQKHEENEQIWQNCIDQYETKNLSLPLLKLKKRGQDGKIVIVLNERKKGNTCTCVFTE